MTLRKMFELLEEAKRKLTDKELDQDAQLYVDNARSQAESQSGEWGDATKLEVIYVSGSCLHVAGW